MTVVWLVTESEALQLLTFAITFYLPSVIMRRRRNDRAVDDESLRGLSAPWTIFGASVLLVVPIGIALYFASAIDLGIVWGIVLLWCWLEIYLALQLRYIARHGTADWKPARRVRESAIAFAITFVAIAALALSESASWPEALATGLVCGFIVLGLGIFFDWLDRRSAPSG